MQKDLSDPDQILKMDDSEFVDRAFKANNFTLKGGQRRFKYRTTNERVDQLINYLSVKEGQVLLSISSSGMQLFEILANKNTPKLILAFDYSLKQVAYNYLLKNAIHQLSFKEFRLYFGIDQGRCVDRKNIRASLVKQIPRQLKEYLPRKHMFGKRALLLNKYNGLQWIHNQHDFISAKKNLNRIKFFKFEMSHRNTKLFKIFKKPFFDIVYLSNVLDWICWHNADVVDIRPLEYIYKDIASVVRKGGHIVITNLLTRKSFVPEFAKSLKIGEKQEISIYKYRWLNYKIYV